MPKYDFRKELSKDLLKDFRIFCMQHDINVNNAIPQTTRWRMARGTALLTAELLDSLEKTYGFYPKELLSKKVTVAEVLGVGK